MAVWLVVSRVESSTDVSTFDSCETTKQPLSRCYLRLPLCRQTLHLLKHDKARQNCDSPNTTASALPSATVLAAESLLKPPAARKGLLVACLNGCSVWSMGPSISTLPPARRGSTCKTCRDGQSEQDDNNVLRPGALMATL